VSVRELTALRAAARGSRAPPALDPVLGRVLQAAAVRGEHFVSVGRIIFCLLILARFISVTPPSPAPYVVNVGALALAIGTSLWILKRIREEKANYSSLALSIGVDALVCFTSLLQTILWPYETDHYRGLLTTPDPAALFVIVYTAGIRVWPRLAVLGAGLNLLSYVMLMVIEQARWGGQLGYGRPEIAMFLVLLGAVMTLSVVTALRTLRLLTSGARNSVQVDRARRKFAEVVREHHDARSMLSAAALASDMVVRALDDRRSVDSVRRHAERLRQDVESAKAQLANLGDRTYDHMNALGELESVDACGVLELSIAALASHFPDIQLDFALPRGPISPLVVVGGAASMQRIIYNLVSNAREGDGQRGARHVVVALQAVDHAIRLRVEDDGPGFPAPALAPGRALPASTKPTGMGLGLLMTAEIVRISGGELEKSNRARGGARVTVTLPTLDAARRAGALVDGGAS
jgi:signal transduction histidine kinase